MEDKPSCWQGAAVLRRREHFVSHPLSFEYLVQQRELQHGKLLQRIPPLQKAPPGMGSVIAGARAYRVVAVSVRTTVVALTLYAGRR